MCQSKEKEIKDSKSKILIIFLTKKRQNVKELDNLVYNIFTILKKHVFYNNYILFIKSNFTTKIINHLKI